MKCASKVHKPFVYTSAAASAKPGYLARKFAAIAKRLAAEKAQAAKLEPKVRQIKKAGQV